MRKTFIALTIVTLLMGGCSSNQPQPSSSTKTKAAEKPVEPAKQAEYLTGREAFQRLNNAARNWSPDSRPLKMESRPRAGDKRDGTASVWTASFASSQRGMMRSFLWSGAVGEGAPEPGISPGGQDSFSPGNASTQPFDPAFLHTDTDNALKVADKNAPPVAKKDKAAPVKFQLYNETSKQRLLWRVIYGGSESSAKAVVDISARDGGFVKIER